MTEYTETHIPKSKEECELWLKEAEIEANAKHLDLANKRIQKQMENKNENNSNKREPL